VHETGEALLWQIATRVHTVSVNGTLGHRCADLGMQPGRICQVGSGRGQVGELVVPSNPSARSVPLEYSGAGYGEEGRGRDVQPVGLLTIAQPLL
jgi:hypothetical protein